MKLLVLASIAVVTVFFSASSEACMQFPCGMYSPTHPANGGDNYVETEKAEPRSVTCTMERVKTVKKGTNKIEATVATKDEEYAYSGKGINYGDRSFSFQLGYSTNDGKPGVDIFVTEDIITQDEVGSFSCALPTSTGVKFCEEPLEFDGKTLFNFSCQAND